MEFAEFTCRFCLKTTDSCELVPLFHGTTNNGDWKRFADFIYPHEGLPTKICTTCWVQVNWAIAFRMQVLENDLLLKTRLLACQAAQNMDSSSDSGYVEATSRNMEATIEKCE
jgi:hypothetical protein